MNQLIYHVQSLGYLPYQLVDFCKNVFHQKYIHIYLYIYIYIYVCHVKKTVFFTCFESKKMAMNLPPWYFLVSVP